MTARRTMHGIHELFEQLRRGVPRAYLARLAAQSAVNGPVTIAVALLIAVFLLMEGYPGAAIWAALQVGLASLILWRWWRNRSRQPAADSTRTRRGLYLAITWAAISGSLWGALTLFIPGAPAHVQVMLVLVMGGMAAGASATLAAVPQVAAAYILTCTLPVTVYYAALGGSANVTLALTFCVFTAAMIAMSGVVFSALTRQFDAERHARELEDMGAALRASEQRFRATFQNAAVGISHVGTDGAWLRVNDRVCEILGYQRDELMATTFQEVTHPDDLALDLELFAAMQRGETDSYQIEKRYLRKDGTPVWCQLTTALQRDAEGQQQYCISVMVDVTSRKQAEQALRESDQAKDEFLAVLGHELRNPLAPLRTGLELLARSPHESEREDVLLPMMTRQLAHLVRLVDDLLDISRINRGVIELRRQPLNLRTPLDAALEQTRALIEQRRHRVIFEPPADELLVNGDRERLTQVFTNLLNNAAKYMATGGTIRVTVATAGHTAIVSVRDEGYGIPPERLESLFELFSQIPEHRANASGGLGVGLSLARRIAEMHGGTITACSDGLSHGSEFVVRLPLSAPPTAEPAAPAPPASAHVPVSVLVVDDNVDAAEGLKQLLELHGHRAETAYDGLPALERVAAAAPDVMLLDLGLPGMDGLEVAQRVRALPGGCDILLVAVTGWGLDEDRQRTAEAGFDLHLTKPIDWAQVAQVIRMSRRQTEGA